MVELVAWIGNALFVLGGWNLARRRRRGFLCMVGGNVAYLVFAAMVGSTALLLLSVYLAGTGVVSYRRWR